MIKTYGPEDDNNTFQNYDGKVERIYFNGIEFNSNSHLYLFGEGIAKNNTFTIISHGIQLDENTTVKEFQKLFPNCKAENYDATANIRFRLYIEEKHDDAFLFYFKNGKLEQVVLWWLLC